jgi:hypothetical protein
MWNVTIQVGLVAEYSFVRLLRLVKDFNYLVFCSLNEIYEQQLTVLINRIIQQLVDNLFKYLLIIS